MLNPPTDAASQFPDIKVLTRLLFSIKEDSIAKKKKHVECIVYIRNLAVLFSFYCFNACIVIAHLYKTF